MGASFQKRKYWRLSKRTRATLQSPLEGVFKMASSATWFRKKGTPMPELLEITQAKDAAAKRREAEEAEAKAHDFQTQIDALALRADKGDEEALAMVSRLDCEIVEQRKLARRKRNAAEQLDMKSREAKADRNRREEKALRKKLVEMSYRRLADAEEFAKCMDGAAAALARLATHTGTLEMAWPAERISNNLGGTFLPSEISTGALLSNKHLTDIVRCEIAYAGNKYQINFPGGFLLSSDKWKGLPEFMRETHAWVRAALLKGPMPKTSLMLAAPPPATPAPEAYDVKPAANDEPVTVPMHLPTPPQSAAEALGLGMNPFTGE